MKLRLFWLLVLLLTACRQELKPDAPFPSVTSVLPTNTPGQSALAPATPTRAFSPAQALVSGPITIITLGDDLTRGDGDTIGRGYPERLLKLVNQIRPGSIVKNFSRSGYTSDDLIHGDGNLPDQLTRALSEVESSTSEWRASIVLIWIGGNDLWELYTGTSEVTAEQEQQDVLRFSENMDTIISSLREAGAEVVVARLDDQAKRPARSRSQTYPDITAGELSRMTKQVQRYNGVIVEKANQYGALTVDFYETDIFTQPETLAPNGFHPNPAGYDLIAQMWYKALIKILP